MQEKEIRSTMAEHPAAQVLAHPECPASVLDLADYVGSTSGILKYAAESSCKEFIICTEEGVAYELRKRNPDKQFYFTETIPICPDMKTITLEKILRVLESGDGEVHIDTQLREQSKLSLERMLELAR